MNIVLFEEHELKDGRLLLTDFRAEHVRDVLGLEVDDSLRIGMVNGRLGQGRIVGIKAAAVQVQVRLDRDPPPAPSVELILALPRPIMLQRILKQAATLGVRRIHLIRSAKVEKSFFGSPALLPERIKERLLDGLSQAAVDTRLPEVLVHPQFKAFVQDVVPKLEGRGLLAHPGMAASLHSAIPGLAEDERILLAVGPEGGWNDFETDCFCQQGFAGFSMGSRILHVDTAVSVLLGQLLLLREMPCPGSATA